MNALTPSRITVFVKVSDAIEMPVVGVVVGGGRTYPNTIVLKVVPRMLVVAAILEDTFRTVLVLNRDGFICAYASRILRREAFDHLLFPIAHFSSTGFTTNEHRDRPQQVVSLRVGFDIADFFHDDIVQRDQGSHKPLVNITK